MRQKTKLVAFFIPVLILGSVALNFLGFSEEKQETVSDLKEQIEALQRRVDILEREKADLLEKSGNSEFLPKDDDFWDPYREISKIQEEINQTFQNSFGQRQSLIPRRFSNKIPADGDMLVKEEKDKYLIELDVTGLDEAKLEVNADKEVITIKGERKEEKVEETKNNYFSSKSYSTFFRTVPVPINADITTMKTENKDGKLIVTIDKINKKK